MKKSVPFLLLLVLPLLALAQGVTVPNNLYFADIHLRISDRAQVEIQKKVDALHRSPKFFQMKVELADAYFPLIERTFKEEGVPDDFKYLALQESGLRGDAVSTSNAVGYWQFKKEAAADFNLRMDHVVDERRHIIEASRGAAKYFKRSNNYYNNWFNALLSYYHGYTGAKAYTKESDKGSKRMDITEKSDPYLLTFLAHKVAYDNFIGKSSPPVVSLRELRATPGQSLADIALAHQTDPSELERYNKWLLGSSIPADKDYYVMLPIRHGNSEPALVASSSSTPTPTKQMAGKASAAASMVTLNNLNALIARKGDTKDKLAMQAGITTRKFLRYNDLRNFDKITEGTAYYVEPKRLNADKEYHVVQPGETMQTISQQYGIRMDYLIFKNRMKRSEVPVPGRVLWLQKRRPAKVPVEVRDMKPSQAAASPVKPVQETRTSQPTATAKTNSTEPRAKQENVFTRFINSFSRFKKQPTEAEPTAATEPAAVEEAAVAEAPLTEERPAEVKIVELVVQPEKQQPKPEATVTEQKNNSAILYPGKKTAETQAAATAQTTEAEEANTTATQGAEATEENFEWAAQEEEELETELLVVESTSPVREASATAAPQTTPATKPARHVVKQGETLYSISRLYAVSVHDITSWNQLGDTPIKIGQELVIAEPLTVPAAPAEETVATPGASATNGIHTVAPSETLFQLSRQYGVSVAELREWNNLKENDLSIGQQLRVVAPATQKSTTPATPEEKPATTFNGSSTYHTVETGESMYQISRKYGVTIKDIMQWNSKGDFNVKPGEKLLIKKK
ncbi:LysM peptidoglycan-binding domain-containing protein [Pontibacter roseus]|uniref:LysM peptidoglycan-binding domain-containing protein n=1 Tax=Pontibacter roseus TaxID=336989 RepID=UPI00036DD07F|nr:LysM peptidoglycan-binding domain-containing protein [Pontibacter roseus]